jgi:hypothetical protein
MSKFRHILTVAGIGASAWLGGMYSERYNIREQLHKPGLPIFATVSAATPIESSVPKAVNRVSEVIIYPNKYNNLMVFILEIIFFLFLDHEIRIPQS